MRTANPFSIVAGALIVLFFADAAQALTNGTSVSRLGDDANPCTDQQPCRTLQAALANTQPGGEIDILDAGEFGAVTISKSISIVSLGGAWAGVDNIIIQNLQQTDEVVLRGLKFDGLRISSVGVFSSAGGSLVIDHCAFNGYTFVSGLGAAALLLEPSGAANLRIVDTLISNSGANGFAGVLIQPRSGGSVTAQLERVQILNSIGNGIRADATNGPVALELHDVTVDGATGGSGIVAVSASGGAQAAIVADDVTSVNNVGYGLRAVGPASTVLLRRSTIANNGVGVGASTGGAIVSFSDNLIRRNISSDGAPTTILPYD